MDFFHLIRHSLEPCTNRLQFIVISAGQHEENRITYNNILN